MDAYNRELLDLVAIPSVSSLPDNHGDLLRAASWLEQRMKTAGLQVTMWHDRVCALVTTWTPVAAARLG